MKNEFPKIKGIENRAFVIKEMRVAAGSNQEPIIEGYAAIFGVYSQNLGGFREIIQKGAFSESIGQDDIRALWNHDANYVLGRNKSGTLELSEDEKGLRIKITPPDAQWAKDLVQSIKRGDVDQMSFAFETISDDWHKEEGQIVRELIKAKLYDVSPVTYPAYTQTSVSARSAFAGLGIEMEELGNAISRAQFGQATEADKTRIGAALKVLERFSANLDTLEGGQDTDQESRQVPLDVLKRQLEIAEAE